MTVPSTSRRAGPFNGNAATTAFPFTFKVFDKTNIRVVKVSTGGVQSTLTLDSDYSVSVNADQTGTPGGTVTYPITGTALASGETLSIIGALPYSQTTALPGGGNFQPGVVEATFDKIVIQNQQLLESIGRTLTLPAGVDPATVSAQLPAPVANGLVGWNSSAQALQNVDPLTLAPINVTSAAQVSTADGGTVATALVSKLNRVVDTIAALRALVKTQYTRAFVTGYNAAGDGGGGSYYYDSTDTASADNGGTIIVATDGGRWKLVHSGSVTVEQFGADGTGTNDSTTAIQNAINAVPVVYALNNYKINATITLSGNKALIGRPGKSNFTCAAGGYYSFSITGSDCVLRNLNMLASAKTGNVTEILINCGTNAINRTIIENVYTNGALGFITDLGSGGSGFHISTFISNCQVLTARGPGIAFSRAFAFQYYEKVTVDYSQVVGAGNANFTGFYLSGSGLPANAGGCVLRDCDVLGTSGTYANANQVGFNFANCAEVWMSRCDADTCDGKGYVFNTVDKLHLDDVTASLCNNTGIEMTSVTNAKGSAIRVNGRQGLGVAAASISGITFVSGCAGIQLSNVLTRSCTGSGVQKVAAQAGSININGLSSLGNAGYGVQSTGNSALLIVGATCVGNTTGNYNLGGTLDYLQVSQINAGTVVSVGPGPVSG